MSGDFAIREGMEVYGGDQLLGRVEALRDDGFEMNGLRYTREMIGRAEGGRVYLGDSGAGQRGLSSDVEQARREQEHAFETGAENPG